MKNYIKIICVVLLAAMYSCEPEEYATPDIELVPIYRLTDTENDNYAIIDIYKEKSLLLIENKDYGVQSYATTEYVDTSTVDNYHVSFTVLTETVDTIRNILSETIRQEIVATVKTTEDYLLGSGSEISIGSLNIEVLKDSTAVTSTITINEDGSEIIVVGDPVSESTQDAVLIEGTITEEEVYN